MTTSPSPRWLADDMWFVTHDDQTGAPGLHRRATELGLAGTAWPSRSRRPSWGVHPPVAGRGAASGVNGAALRIARLSRSAWSGRGQPLRACWVRGCRGAVGR